MAARILILDEDRTVLEDLCSSLRGAGRSLEVHASAEAAWASIDRDPPDVVVLSARFQGLLGRPFVEDLRQHFADRLGLVVADVRAEDDEPPAAGSSSGREARLRRSLRQPELVQRAVSRMLAGEDPASESEVEADSTEREGGPESTPLWETPSVGLLDQLMDGIVITDRAGVVVFMNPAAAQLLQVSPSEVLHRSFATIAVEPGLRQLFEGALAGQELAGQSVCIPRAQREGVVEVRIAPLEAESERAQGWFIGLHDISEQVQVDRLRGHYLTVVAHELRTPLTVLNNLLSLLAPGPTKVGQAAGQQVRRLEHQIDKLLLLASRGRPRETAAPRRFDLREVVREAVDSSAQQAEEQGTAFRIRLPEQECEVVADADDLRRALYELAENAVKFTPPGGAVCVSVSQEAGRVEVEVQDTGIGIDPQHHGAVFDEFRQLERPVTRSYGGAGLGLSLARGLVESWGGTIRVDSGESVGSTFTLSLPGAPEERRGAPSEELVAMSGSGESDDG